MIRSPQQTRLQTPLVAATTGRSFPLGATLTAGGANFSVFSRSAAGIDLLFFDRVDDARPSRVIPIDPFLNRTYHYWHVFVPGVEAGQIYGFRAHGPFEPDRGLRFDASKLLLDPYGRAVAVPKHYSREAARLTGGTTATAMKSAVTDPQAYDWEGDLPLKRPWSRTIIYEMHVRGLTAHPSSGVREPKRGTYAGLVQKIPYLQQLGITAVELLPVFQFDAQDAPCGLTNYWGYSPVSFFAPHQAYSSRRWKHMERILLGRRYRANAAFTELHLSTTESLPEPLAKMLRERLPQPEDKLWRLREFIVAELDGNFIRVYYDFSRGG